MDCTGKAVAIIRTALWGQLGGREGTVDGAAGGVCVCGGGHTNCMLEEEDQIMKRMRE